MRRLLKNILLSLLLCVTVIFGFGGCRGSHDPAIAGGTVDKTDPKAPKVIQSKDIRDFYARFCLYGEWSPGNETQTYTFTVNTDESGVLTASEMLTGATCAADSDLLQALQTVIDDYNLAEKNGVYRVTAGLPPEFQEGGITVHYASGETLTFTENNNPDAEWAKRMYLAFADWFSAHGDDTLQPPVRDAAPENLSLRYDENGTVTNYRIVQTADGMSLSKTVYDAKTNAVSLEDEKPLPADYAERLAAILGGYDLRPFDCYSALYGLGRTADNDGSSNTSVLEIRIDYDDGDRLPIGVSDENDVAMLQPLTDALTAYYDSLFA